MAGRMRGLLGQLERMLEKVDAIDEELGQMRCKYTRMGKGVWQEHAEAASDALADACGELEVLTLMAGDLIGERNNNEDTDTNEVDEGDPGAEKLSHTPGTLRLPPL